MGIDLSFASDRPNADFPLFCFQEEEDYANFLGHEFWLGLSEIDNGVTKRAYLSSKLTCTKMRISKKFKGESLSVFTQSSAPALFQLTTDVSIPLL